MGGGGKSSSVKCSMQSPRHILNSWKNPFGQRHYQKSGITSGILNRKVCNVR